MSTVANINDDTKETRARSLWQDAVKHFVRDRLTLIAFIVLVLMTLACYLAPPVLEDLLDVDATRTNTPASFTAPGVDRHVLGTDHLGRDQLIRLLYGGRVSLAVAYTSSIMIIFIGVSLGLLAGFYGGLVDDTITWLVNTLSSVPSTLLYIVIAAIWQPPVEWMIIILALLGWVGTSRLVRAEVLSIKEREYVLAARALGASDFRLLVSHIFPNLMSIVIVTGSIIAGNLILVEAGLSYLGVGVQPPTPTWGNMLTDSRTYFVQGVHLVIWPGIMILITVMCFYLVGDGLRDALDPHQSRHSKA
ncbi:MAG: ABC transporter permease [Anaerolineae bacterium]|jgi:ABC-type dipeptide/oligopeptide/nickel transport systems, permease components|nr:MAG: binding-protein-dependent transport system inner membrane component [Chloroflexi bacterium OLB13]MBC6955240.1 ABC transporter permease [Chloroflexota bacterium]MBV6434934.1 Glutathione transport system permease protein GsiD [Anaerolineae bacterium]MDL1916258.1 ABC transporter permease [Anaerolineae bacterium CFX4]MBW7877977.1 ABC transporter permease [Anaerolineae bacterium]